MRRDTPGLISALAPSDAFCTESSAMSVAGHFLCSCQEEPDVLGRNLMQSSCPTLLAWGSSRVEFFLVPFFCWCRIGALFFGGRLELCHFCTRWQEKCRIADEFRVQGFATQHSF